MTINDLPNFLICDNCSQRHFLSLNKDADGNWSIGYLEYKNNTVILGMNNSSSIREATIRMHYALERYGKASGQIVK